MDQLPMYQREIGFGLERSLIFCVFRSVSPIWGLSLGIQDGVAFGRTNP
jgi:hypothetical protein